MRMELLTDYSEIQASYANYFCLHNNYRKINDKN